MLGRIEREQTSKEGFCRDEAEDGKKQVLKDIDEKKKAIGAMEKESRLKRLDQTPIFSKGKKRRRRQPSAVYNYCAALAESLGSPALPWPVVVVDCRIIGLIAGPVLSRKMEAKGSEWWSGETVAVVTGGNRGIGLEVCRQLADKGLTVIMTARQPQEQLSVPAQQFLQEAAEAKRKNVISTLDITQQQSVLDFVDWLKLRVGFVDILVSRNEI
ncbi:hypothetical protein EJ110_NYTH16737 [Nymphaea thermarum]|nr:hypothetical protein EJ110_NYTH16737 [Nymphaea thermarum]